MHQARRTHAGGTPDPVPPVTVEVASGVQVHGVVTGFVAVKAAHREMIGPAWARYAAIVLDPRWTEWLPIYTWVIEHPEGVIVVDTGETARVADPGYFDCDPATRFVFGRLLGFALGPEQEIGPQLRALGIPPEEVRRVVVTHLHSDHAGGLVHFPKAEFLVGRRELETKRGAVPCRWPSWFEPRLVAYESGPVGAFEESHALTGASDLFVVPTPGHSLGHQSVMFLDGERTIFFAGDASFSEVQVRAREVAGISEDVAAARRTLEKIREQLVAHRTVYLPSHDAGSGPRLGGLVATAGA